MLTMTTRVSLFLAAALLAICLTATPSRCAAAVNSRAIANYYFELFGDLVADCAIEDQAELTRSISALNLERKKRPDEAELVGKPEAAERLRRRFEPVYRKARESLGAIVIVWEDGKARLADDTKPLSAAAGLRRHVLIEIDNRDAVGRTIRSAFDLPEARNGRAPFVPAGETRALVASFVVEQTGGRTIPLRIKGPSGPTVLEIPVLVQRPATLRGKLMDTDRKRTFPGRVTVRGADGILRPGAAFRDITTPSMKSVLRTGKNYRLPFFYSDGSFEVQVPPGETTITLERGYEHDIVSKTVTLAPGEIRELSLESARFLNMRNRGWISGDTHVHWSINAWNEDEDLELLRVVQRAEDIHVINNLTLRHWHPVKGEFTAPTQYPMGTVPGHSDGEYHIQMGEEYRNAPFYGHLNFLNITKLIQPISTGDLMGREALDYPLNHSKILEARAQGGIVISAHGTPAEIPADIAMGILDSIDQSTPEQYYALLNCGFRLPITTGSDHPARLVGHCRCYVKIDGEFSYANWIEGIRKRRTFVTSGPLVFLSVNGAEIGDVLEISKGEKLRIRVEAHSRRRIGKLQIVSNKKILKEVEIDGRTGALEIELDADESRWIVARCFAGGGKRPLAERDIAHTSAIYVEVDGQNIFNPTDARNFATRLRRHALNVQKNAMFENDEQRPFSKKCYPK